MSVDELAGVGMSYDEMYRKEVLMESELAQEDKLELRLWDAKKDLEELRARRLAESEGSTSVRERQRVRKEVVRASNEALQVRRENSTRNKITIGMRRAIVRRMFGAIGSTVMVNDTPAYTTRVALAVGVKRF